jgi:Rab-GTPase-TBC domain
MVSVRLPARTSLREQFKLLRMREEVGIASLDDNDKPEGGAIAGLIGRSASVGIGVASPQSMADDKAEAAISPQSPLPQSISSVTINSNLAPGTVSGLSAAVADAATPIDWDFWQTVVNEGPQVVARTSPEELTRAIAGGIPQTIRGVIWQVMANSKNEDLEAVYQDLRIRGTSQEIRENNYQASIANGGVNGTYKSKESIGSSSSSIHSEHSTPGTSANLGISSSPSHEPQDPINITKQQAQLTAEKMKKVKEDAAALSKLEKMIKRDMGSRTSYSKYAVAGGLQDGLFNVCKAYALFDEAVGYPQGMNFIIMPMLFAMPEEEAFCLLVRLMNKYHLREMFIQDMPGLHLHLYQFERLLEDLEPALYCHLNRRSVTPKLYATQWFLTLFAYRFPLQLVMRVYDLVLCEGLEGAILKFGMAVIQRNVLTLLSMNDMLALTNFLKEKIFDVYIDSTPSSKSLLESGFFGSSGGTDAEVYRADLLVQDACAVKLTPEMLNKYREEWEDMTKVEKAREAELESLRTELATKTAIIRSLEQRAQKSDAEHIEIANELVRLKVENQEMLDSNESLLGQVEELKKVADSEAANAEEKLKAEMERVRERNAEVQNQNRHMEDSMAEMEQELVATKMKYAEVSPSIRLLMLTSMLTSSVDQ